MAEVQEAVLTRRRGVGPTTRVRPVAGRRRPRCTIRATAWSSISPRSAGSPSTSPTSARSRRWPARRWPRSSSARRARPVAAVRSAARGPGATIGGTVACGLNGPGRFRHGGVRDFLIGAQVRRRGRAARARRRQGGQERRRLLPAPADGRQPGTPRRPRRADLQGVPDAARAATVRVTCRSLADALAALDRVRRSTTDPDAVELTADGAGRGADRRRRRGPRRAHRAR